MVRNYLAALGLLGAGFCEVMPACFSEHEADWVTRMSAGELKEGFVPQPGFNETY